MTNLTELRDHFGEIDVYLFDQLLKGRITPGARILDAGCGGGRNVAYLLRQGCDVSAVDTDPHAVARVAQLARSSAPQLGDLAGRFRVAPLDALGFAAGSFDVVLAIAVLHFAADEAHFDRMHHELWRVLAPGGMLFARLASRIGLEDRIEALGGGRYHLPDGSDRFLVDEGMLVARGRKLGAELLEPLKTVNVQGMRCMTTWVLRKPEGERSR